MSGNPFNRNLANITDSSDWQQTKLPNLSELDSLKRCYICKEFFKAPVTTSCNHTFCSQCIREYLITNNLCPLCKTELFESNLRRDILLDEIVTCYTRIRPYLFELLKKDLKAAEESKENTPKKRVVQDVIEILSEEESPNDSAPENKRIKLEPPSSIPAKDDLVECPICCEKMPAELLQSRHIDDCLSGKKTVIPKYSLRTISKKKSSRTGIASFFKNLPLAASPTSLPEVGHKDFYINEVSKQNDAKKLPKLDFLSLTTPKLKEKVAILKLPTSGTRVQLELRYNQYYVLFNSNLDSNRPVSDKILKQKLNQWELSHLAFTTTTANLFNSRNHLSNKSITDKNFLPKEWSDAFKKDFRRLTRAAKKSVRVDNSKELVIPPDHKEVPELLSEPLVPSLSGLMSEHPAPLSAPLSVPLSAPLAEPLDQIPSALAPLSTEKSEPFNLEEFDFKKDISESPLFK